MRKLFILITALACNLCAMAQDNLVATLQRGGNIQAFYGEDALSAAHQAAANGDIITLSAGEFNGCEITKAITLRGEGMDKTHIKSQMTFTIPEKSTRTLTLEGLNISYQATQWDKHVSVNGSDGSEKVIVSKCLINANGANDHLIFEKCNGTVMQSHIYGTIAAHEGSHVTCLNSICQCLMCEGSGKFDVENCNIKPAYAYQLSYVHYSTIKNTIIHISNPELDGTNTYSHCLTAGLSTIPVSKFGWTLPDTYNAWEGIVDGNYRLSEEAAATYLGTDGTQIGIYGGMYPYDPTPSYPLVKKLDVIGSHKNGKLNVKINVE